MKSIFAALILLSTVSFASEAPSAYYVAASILKDSGIDDATQISGTHIATERMGSEDQTTHILRFNRGQESYTCDYVFRAGALTFGHYAVEAEMRNCQNESGAVLRLNNDYTNDNGVVHFERLFFDNNSKFRPLTAQERQRFLSRTGRTFRDGPSIRIVNPQNTNRVILINEGQMIPIN
ncbi:MAG: hypothetical protein K0R29_458 [Pseudobdellovibrio sp.]|jgi:hypothetical protein|nr:hypothetical protein [Pseudobdellovibrio sp.]